MKRLISLFALLTLSVNYNSQCLTPIYITSQTICAGQSTTLTATGANTYTWSNGLVSPSIVVSPSLDTPYGVLSNICPVTTWTFIAVNTPSITFPLVSSVNNCGSTTATLGVLISTGNGIANGSGVSYTWTPGSVSKTIAININTTKIYTVISSWNNICLSNTYTIPVNVYQTPTLSTMLTKSVICSGDNSNLSIIGAKSWTCLSSVKSWTGTWANTNISMSPTVTTSYTINGESDGCLSSSVIETVKVNDCITNTSIFESNTKKFDIYPNPSDGEISVNFDIPTFAEIVNALGQKVISAEFKNGDKISLSPGIYYMIVGKSNKKIVIR